VTKTTTEGNGNGSRCSWDEKEEKIRVILGDHFGLEVAVLEISIENCEAPDLMLMNLKDIVILLGRAR
jgi:hypothetical protein